jgi:predicted PurR-regulated permease PerM
MTAPARDLLRIVLAVMFIGILTTASLWILQPFLLALTWATMIVVTTWPLMLRVQRGLAARRSLAVIVMTAAMLAIFVVPLAAAIVTLVENADEIGRWAVNLGEVKLPMPPDWVKSLPLVGTSLDTNWRDLATAGPSELALLLKPYTQTIVAWLASHAGGFGLLFVHVLLTVVLSAVLYARGEAAAAIVRRFAARLAAERGEGAVHLAGQAIRAVALGVVVTAVIQTLLGWAGLALAGVPFSSVLAAIMLMLAIAQIGVVPVMLCAVGWLYWKDMNTAATALLVWTVFVGAIDNVIRPILIKQGANLPLLLIFAGVIGGLLGFGLVGLFLGPVVLGVSYTLLRAWIDEGRGSGQSGLPKS